MAGKAESLPVRERVAGFRAAFGERVDVVNLDGESDATGCGADDAER